MEVFWQNEGIRFHSDDAWGDAFFIYTNQKKGQVQFLVNTCKYQQSQERKRDSNKQKSKKERKKESKKERKTSRIRRSEKLEHSTLQHAATRCNSLQLAVTHCNSPQLTATHCNSLQLTETHARTRTGLEGLIFEICLGGRHGIHCNTLQRTATHCDTLQHTATHNTTLQHTAPLCNTLQHTAKPFHTHYLAVELLDMVH